MCFACNGDEKHLAPIPPALLRGPVGLAFVDQAHRPHRWAGAAASAASTAAAPLARGLPRCRLHSMHTSTDQRLACLHVHYFLMWDGKDGGNGTAIMSKPLARSPPHLTASHASSCNLHTCAVRRVECLGGTLATPPSPPLQAPAWQTMTPPLLSMESLRKAPTAAVGEAPADAGHTWTRFSCRHHVLSERSDSTGLACSHTCTRSG